MKQETYHKKFTDIFTIGHFIKGLISYFVIFQCVIFLGFQFDEAFYISLNVAFVCSLIWEYIENFLISHLKPQKTKDSLKNALTDILFDMLGAITGAIIIILI